MKFVKQVFHAHKLTLSKTNRFSSSSTVEDEKGALKISDVARIGGLQGWWHRLTTLTAHLQFQCKSSATLVRSDVMYGRTHLRFLHAIYIELCKRTVLQRMKAVAISGLPPPLGFARKSRFRGQA